MALTEVTIQKRGVDYFRRVVALVYREIGVLKACNHPAIFSKANLAAGFFGQSRKAEAKQLYKLSLTDISTIQTLERYAKRTGLTLDDVHEAFLAGNWRTPYGRVAFGGPKWATIAKAAMQLGSAVQDEAWPEVKRLADLVETLEHNSAMIVGKFAQLD